MKNKKHVFVVYLCGSDNIDGEVLGVYSDRVGAIRKRFREYDVFSKAIVKSDPFPHIAILKVKLKGDYLLFTREEK